MNQDASNALVDYMIDLCQEHMSAGWVSHWEHLLWDAMLSDGTLLRYEGVDERKLSAEEVTKLRGLFKNADTWPVFKTRDLDDLRFVYALVETPIILADVEYENTLSFPVGVWKQLHSAWLHTPSGRANYTWRMNVYKETMRQVEEIAEERDRLVETIERAATDARNVFDEKLILDGFDRSKRSRMLLAWLPEDLKARVTIRYMPGVFDHS